MKKILGVAIVVLFVAPLVASGMEIAGKVKSVDPAAHAFVLEDGTQLWVDDSQLAELREGVLVRAAYETRGGKKIVTQIERRLPGNESTNFGTRAGVSLDSIEAD